MLCIKRFAVHRFARDKPIALQDVLDPLGKPAQACTRIFVQFAFGGFVPFVAFKGVDGQLRAGDGRLQFVGNCEQEVPLFLRLRPLLANASPDRHESQTEQSQEYTALPEDHQRVPCRIGSALQLINGVVLLNQQVGPPAELHQDVGTQYRC